MLTINHEFVFIAIKFTKGLSDVFAKNRGRIRILFFEKCKEGKVKDCLFRTKKGGEEFFQSIFSKILTPTQYSERVKSF